MTNEEKHVPQVKTLADFVLPESAHPQLLKQLEVVRKGLSVLQQQQQQLTNSLKENEMNIVAANAEESRLLLQLGKHPSQLKNTNQVITSDLVVKP